MTHAAAPRARVPGLPNRDGRFGEAPADFVARMTAAHGLEGALSFTDFLRRSVDRDPDKTALVYEDARYSYAGLFQAIDDAAAWLVHEAKIAPGDKVAMMVDNSDHYIVWYLAMLAAGIVSVPLNTKLVGREIAYQLDNSGAVFIVADAAFLRVVADAEKALGRTLPKFLTDTDRVPAGLRDKGLPPVPDIDAPAAVYYTSGTTGAPKGVVHTHRGLIFMALQAGIACEFGDPGLVFLGMMPLFHIASHVLVLPTLYLGGTLVVATYSTEAILEIVEREGVNAFFAVPSMLLMMVQSPARGDVDLSGVQVIQFGAAPMAIERLGEVQALFPNASLVHCMGQTESVGLIVTLPSDQAIDKLGSVGLPIPGCERRVVDGDDKDVAAGQVGELVARGPNVMVEYLANPDASADTLRGGWLHTGDLGYLDEDGYLYLVDRKKDMIIRGGENIYSTEVEDVIYGHDGVALAAVVGMPSDLFGEEVCAFVVRKPDAAFEEADLQAHCRAQLAPFKVPRKVIFLDDFPMTATGKIQKQELKKLPEFAGAVRAAE